jgi:hypothetical protein
VLWLLGKILQNALEQRTAFLKASSSSSSLYHFELGSIDSCFSSWYLKATSFVALPAYPIGPDLSPGALHFAPSTAAESLASKL